MKGHLGIFGTPDLRGLIIEIDLLGIYGSANHVDTRDFISEHSSTQLARLRNPSSGEAER